MDERKRSEYRNVPIDMMKGFIVVLMTCSHLIGVTSFYFNYEWVRVFVTYVNLTTFSGFLFCFGYVCYSAYIDREDRDRVVKHLIKNAFKVLIAFYISALSYTVTLAGGTGNFKKVFDVLLLQSIPTLSEFLVSFVLLDIFLIFFGKYLRDFSGRKLVIAIILSLLATLYPYEYTTGSILGSVIGTTKYCCFPVIQYSSYFLLGIWFAKEKITFSKRVLIGSLCGTTVFLGYYFRHDALPNRFPPTMAWIMGAAVFIYCYFLLFNNIYQFGMRIKWLEYFGKNTLTVLVVGNVMIFLLRFISKEDIQKTITTFSDIWKYLVIVVTCFVISSVLIKIKKIFYKRR